MLGSRRGAGTERVGAPRQRARLLRAVGITSEKMESVRMAALFREFCAWKRSAKQYASAVELYGQVCASAQVAPWPPSGSSRDLLAAVCRRAGTLAAYIRAVASVLRLLGAPAGAFGETRALILGARKVARQAPRRGRGFCGSRNQADLPGEARFKARATAGNVRDMAAWLRTYAQREDVADSFIVAWQFCLRFGSEVCGLGDPRHSEITVEHAGGKPQVGIRFAQRKGCMNPDPVGAHAPRNARRGRWAGPPRVQVWRVCVCGLQGKRLCAVCILHKRYREMAPVFPDVRYEDALAYVKITASKLGLPRALEWGTHCFRRGRADLARAVARARGRIGPHGPPSARR